jgi:hypothetical protein
MGLGRARRDRDVDARARHRRRRRFTAWLASKTSELATETAEDVRAGIRPALIDAAETTGASIEVGTEGDVGAVRLTVRNAGAGPALNIYAYALVVTSVENTQTPYKIIGNVAPNDDVRIEIPSVPNRDTSGGQQSYLALRVVLVYSDLADRRYHTVIRLTDPEKGQRRELAHRTSRRPNGPHIRSA